MQAAEIIPRKFKLFQRKSKWFSGISYNSTLRLNIYFCKSKSNFYLASRHIELITRYLKWKLKKRGSLAFPQPTNYPLTKKPTEIRMGKGKGGIFDWVIPVKKGSIPFLFEGKKSPLVKKLMLDVLKKLPIISVIAESKHYFKQASKKSIFFSRYALARNQSLVNKIF